MINALKSLLGAAAKSLLGAAAPASNELAQVSEPSTAHTKEFGQSTLSGFKIEDEKTDSVLQQMGDVLVGVLHELVSFLIRFFSSPKIKSALTDLDRTLCGWNLLGKELFVLEPNRAVGLKAVYRKDYLEVVQLSFTEQNHDAGLWALMRHQIGKMGSEKKNQTIIAFIRGLKWEEGVRRFKGENYTIQNIVVPGEQTLNGIQIVSRAL